METLDINEPVLPRKRKIPQRYDGNHNEFNHCSIKAMYRQMYFESYDYIINAITESFDQPDFKMYATMQNVFLYAINGLDFASEMVKPTIKNNVSFVDLYSDEVDVNTFKTQLELLPSIFKAFEPVSIHNIFKFVREMTIAKRNLISEVITLINLIVVAPATNAESERIFSAMKRVKSYLRNKMTNQRLNHLMVMHVHKDRLDNLNFVDVGNTFVGANQRRNAFSVFSDIDCKINEKFTRDSSTQTENIN